MAVWYLDNDDEITDAVARLRGASDEQIVFVVPPGSRIATGRINFRLLAREARSRDLHMAIASPDEQVRALAASAGVLTTRTADEATAALARGDEPPEPSEAAPAPSQTEAAVTTTGAAIATTGLIPGWSTQRLIAVTAAVLLVALVALYVAYQTLPTAEITLVPRAIGVGPLDVPVTASTDLTEPDVEGGRIPAVSLPISLSIERIFPATGVITVASPASGEVVFSSSQTFQDIAAGTPVRTPTGIEFQTTQRVTLAAPGAGETVSSVTAPVIAVEPGAEGNVAADEISVVPSLEDQGISVANPAPTTGGRVEESPRVSTADYNGAVADIENRFPGALEAWLRDPANVPEGLTLFPDTVVRGPITYDPGLDDVVGSEVAAFTLTGSREATVLAVDEHLVDQLVRERLLAAVPDELAMLDDRVSVVVDPGEVDGQRITFQSRAAGEAVRPVDAAEMASRIAGLPISEARAILEDVGHTTVTVWPEFLADLPGDPSRITFDVREPSTTE